MLRMTLPVTRRQLGMLLRRGEERILEAIQVLQPHLKNWLTKAQVSLVRAQLTTLRSNFQAFRNRQRAKVGNSKLLENLYFDEKITFPIELIIESGPIQETSKEKLPYLEIGCSDIDYVHKRARAQTKDVTSLKKNPQKDTVPLLRTTRLAAKKRRLDSVVKITNDTTVSSGRPAKMTPGIKRGIEAENKETFSPEEALDLILQLGLTHDKYKILRSAFKAKGYKKILPAYAHVLEAKKQSRPPKYCLEVNEMSASGEDPSIISITTCSPSCKSSMIIHDLVDVVKNECDESLYNTDNGEGYFQFDIDQQDQGNSLSQDLSSGLKNEVFEDIDPLSLVAVDSTDYEYEDIIPKSEPSDIVEGDIVYSMIGMKRSVNVVGPPLSSILCSNSPNHNVPTSYTPTILRSRKCTNQQRTEYTSTSSENTILPTSTSTLSSTIVQYTRPPRPRPIMIKLSPLVVNEPDPTSFTIAGRKRKKKGNARDRASRKFLAAERSKCTVCGFTTFNHQQKRYHLQKYHPGEFEKLKQEDSKLCICLKCEKTFHSVDTYRWHLSRVHNVSPDVPSVAT